VKLARLFSEADIELRRAERFSVLGDPSAKTKLLANKIRSGELSRRHVAIAAALGHGPSQSLGLEESYTFKGDSPLEQMLSALTISRLSYNEITKFVIDCAEQVLPVFEKVRPNDDRPRRAVEAARSGNRHKAAIAQTAASVAADLALSPGGDIDIEAPAEAAAEASSYVAAAVAYPKSRKIGRDNYYALSEVLRAGLDFDWIKRRLISYLLGEV